MTKEELFSLECKAVSKKWYRQVKKAWDQVAKPLDSLGQFEKIVCQIGAIQNTTAISIQKKVVLAFCADNGIVAEGISQSGQGVTKLVAISMGHMNSSVCRMAKQIGADVMPIDVGINTNEILNGVLNRKVRKGTRNFLQEPAMTEREVLQALRTGMEMVENCKELGYQLIALGEMGIGNTTTSSALAAGLTGLSPEKVTGRGAGLPDDKLQHKIEVIRTGLSKYGYSDRVAESQEEVFDCLISLGGLDIAAMAGAVIGGAIYQVPIVLDGVISVVAAAIANGLVPGACKYAIASHISKEPAAKKLLFKMGMKPVIDAKLALGEGTGAVMLMGLLDTVMAVYQESSSFQDLQMEQYERF